jgi:hypothetical protein
MKQSFEDFVNNLAIVEVDDDAYNQYAITGGEGNAVRRANLIHYLSQMAELEPRIMLVGEAPGYQGCARSGVPFTSDAILLDPPPGIPIFGPDSGYRMAPEFDTPRKEPSATIIWQTIAMSDLLPLIWSAFPFHPHKLGKPLSNRAPRVSEVALGEEFLVELLERFRPEVVVAVGNTADRSLNNLEIKHVKVRHPSQGGKNDFVAGFLSVAEGVKGVE